MNEQLIEELEDLKYRLVISRDSAILDKAIQSLQPKEQLSAEEVLKPFRFELDDFGEITHNTNGDYLFYSETIQAMYDFANNSEAMKKHAIKFARYYIANKSIIDLNKDNDEEVYQEFYLTNKEK